MIIITICMTKDVLVRLYDALAWLTDNYSLLPEDFKKRFSETELVKFRQSVFNSIIP